LTTTWAYDIDNVLHEFTGAGITLKYVNGDDTDEPLARVDGSGNVDYHHADALGSITEMTDPAGNITFMRQYDAWGKLEQGIAVAGYAFTGREWDFETGLYYYRARYYDPRLGRFASEDPLSLREGPSAYVYVDNAPVGLRDPYGLQATPPKPPRKPTPKPTPTPTPTPPSRPKNPPGSAGSTLPAVFNLCWPDGIVSYELGPNPYKDYGSWVKWKNDFIQACDDAQPPGKNYYSSCPGNPIVNPHHPGSNGICCCCEYKQRSCNNPKSEDPS
jgi:RHS repeat-associated protein